MLRVFILSGLLLAGCSQSVHYVASKKSDVFHRASCSEVSHIKSENLLQLGQDRQTAAREHRACDVCKP
ncbi:MAG: hypothetical protein U0931_16115 [Vulcanimicrobiota bacterium]